MIPLRAVLACALALAPFGGAALGQGSLLLAGGGSEGSDGDRAAWSWRPYGWFVDKALAGGPNGGNGRILVIDYEAYPQCDDVDVGYCSYFESLGATGADALWLSEACPDESGCVPADSAAAYRQILTYDGVWFRGGDQARYVAALSDTPAERALAELFRAGGVIGGTSAGAMALSEVVSAGDAPSYEATADPYHPAIRLETSFLAGISAVLPGTVVDTHLTERARLGRLAVFVGRLEVGGGRDLLGIGLDSETALTIEPDGLATVHGQGAVTFLRWAPSSELVFRAGLPPYIASLDFDQLTEGFVFDLRERRVVAVPEGAVPARRPPSRLEYGSGVLSGGADGHRRKGEWFATWNDGASLTEGTLRARPGTGLIDNAAVVSRLEDVTSLRENKAGGGQWLLGENPTQGLVVYLDGFNGQEFNRIRVRDDETLRLVPPADGPEQSALILDCHGLQWVARSRWDDDGDGRARQSVALTPCRLHLLNSRTGKTIYDVEAHHPVGAPSGR